MEFKDDEDRTKSFKRMNKDPKFNEYMHKSACEYVDFLQDSGRLTNKNGDALRWAIMEALPEYPEMKVYSGMILEEAKRRGIKFKDEDDKKYV